MQAGATLVLKAQKGVRMARRRRLRSPMIRGISAFMDPLTSRYTWAVPRGFPRMQSQREAGRTGFHSASRKDLRSPGLSTGSRLVWMVCRVSRDIGSGRRCSRSTSSAVRCQARMPLPSPATRAA
jgi:hypothetical protein